MLSTVLLSTIVHNCSASGLLSVRSLKNKRYSNHGRIDHVNKFRRGDQKRP